MTVERVAVKTLIEENQTFNPTFLSKDNKTVDANNISEASPSVLRTNEEDLKHLKETGQRPYTVPTNYWNKIIKEALGKNTVNGHKVAPI